MDIAFLFCRDVRINYRCISPRERRGYVCPFPLLVFVRRRYTECEDVRQVPVCSSTGCYTCLCLCTLVINFNNTIFFVVQVFSNQPESNLPVDIVNIYLSSRTNLK